MKFTDDDLAEMESRLDPKGARAVVGYPIEKWRALLSRLEASEQCAETLEDLSKFTELPSKVRIVLEVWRKAACKP